MNIDYSLLEHDSELFKNSSFAKIVEGIIGKLELPEDRNCSVFIQTLSGNPDVVGLCCRDLDLKRLLPGTPSYGAYCLTRSAYELYDADVNDSEVVDNLNRLDEFLNLVKRACI